MKRKTGLSRSGNRGNARKITAGLSLSMAVQGLTAFAQTNTTWVGPAGGSWATAGNWSGGAVPNNGGTRYNAFIDAGQAPNNAVLLTTSVTVNDLTISAGDQLNVNNAIGLTLVGNDVTGALINAGTINLNSTGSATSLTFNTASIGLSGGGFVNMSNAARISGTGTLNNLDNTVAGAGSFGFNTLNVINAGTIAALGAGSLNVDPNGNGMVNTGTLLADTGASLRILAGTISGSGGKVIARNGATVSLTGSSALDGQAFSTFGTGVIETPASASVTISNFTNSGNYVGLNLSSTFFSGNNSNTGSMNISSTGSGTNFQINGGTVTLTGGGTVNLSGQLARVRGVGTLVTDNYIRGVGNVGLNETAIRSSGTVACDVAGGSLTIDGDINFGMVNSGTVLASNGGTLIITGTNVDNTVGSIRALSGSTVSFSGSSAVTGGTLVSIGDGILRADPSQIVTLSNLSINGNYLGANLSNTFFTGTINNLGTMTIASTGGSTDLELLGGGTATLAGGGTIVMQGVAFVRGAGTIVTNNFIRGVGFVGNNESSLRNSGTVVADVIGGTLTVDPATGGAFVNSGTLAATNGGILSLTTGDYDNTSGRIFADNNSIVSITGGAVIAGGSLSTSGSGVVRTAAGNVATLRDLTNAGRYVGSNLSTTFIEGTITNVGSVTLASTGGGTNFQLSGGGTVTLGGGGTVNLESIARVRGTGTLITDNYIRGVGNVGLNETVIRNLGTIAADVAAGSLTVDPALSSSLVNAGMLLATGGGRMFIANGTIENAGGVIMAAGSSTVTLTASALINGGTLATAGDGIIETNPGNTTTLRNVANFGNYVAGNLSTTFLEGSITNAASFTLASTGAGTNLQINGGGTVTLTGGGTVNLQSIARVRGLGTLVTDNSFRGVGAFGLNEMSAYTSGLIAADVNAGSITLDPNASGVFVNTGVYRAVNGGTMLLSAGSYNCAGGTFEALAASSINFASGASITGGNATVHGTLVNSSTSGVSIGNVAGTGSVLNTAGTIAAAHYRVGTLSANTGTIQVSLNGTDSGASKVSNVVLSGAARLNLTDNDLIVTVTPRTTVEASIVNARNGGSWNMPGITSSAAKAQASQATTLGVMSGAEYFSIYGGGAPFAGLSVAASDTLVKYTWCGDADFNAEVNFDDYVRIDAGFNGGLSGWFNGDFDLSGTIDFDDYVLIDLGFNAQTGTLRRAMAYLSGDDRSTTNMEGPALRAVVDHFDRFGVEYATSFLAAVPEPTGAVIATVGGCWALSRRRAIRSRLLPSL